MDQKIYTSGSEVEPGTYKCTRCGNEIKIDKKSKLPKCARCGNDKWHKIA
ncbi:zinc ribbon-containing protein [Breznakiella homolactica]|uniref:Uncharacterized protein n=1 Tax=Breznakiella homolactica TaxID=2798577 RepID=A0A7T8BBF7_9SPIR|nr:zinc ribbon-containing protein [Breznakiella homolactica]QQO09183.1 zinc ribbon-containing protein [Breznakiella homolactica]